jgi:hypothetical protein
MVGESAFCAGDCLRLRDCARHSLDHALGCFALHRRWLAAGGRRRSRISGAIPIEADTPDHAIGVLSAIAIEQTGLPRATENIIIAIGLPETITNLAYVETEPTSTNL